MCLEDHLDVVTGVDTAGVVVVGEGEVTGLISSAEVDLGAVVGAETSAAATLLLGQDVHGHQELLGGLGAAGEGNDHTTADVFTLDTTEQQTRVVTGLGEVAGLLEGLNIGDLGLDGHVGATNDFNLGILLQHTALDTARNDGTTTGDGEDFLNGHEEGLVHVTLGRGDPGVNGLHEIVNAGGADLGAAVLEGAQGGTEDDGGLLTLEAVGVKQIAHLHLDKLKHLGVLDGVDLVHENNDLLDTDLAGKQQVLTGLGHLAIGSSNDDDGTVHVGSTSNHVLNVIGVTGAVDVGVVTVFGLELNVGRRNGDTTLALLGSLVNGIIGEEVGQALGGLVLGDGSSQGGL